MARPDAPEMNLPEGKTCSDCVSFVRCRGLISSLKGTEDSCDWSPSRFKQKPAEPATVSASNSHAVLIEELTKLREENKQLRAGKLPGGARITIQCPFCEAKAREIQKLKSALCERDKLISQQRSRVQQAEALWRQANDKPGLKPDLGALVEWLMAQPAEAVAKRDKLWCEAAIAALDTREVQRLMEMFNGLRAEKPEAKPVTEAVCWACRGIGYGCGNCGDVGKPPLSTKPATKEAKPCHPPAPEGRPS